MIKVYELNLPLNRATFTLYGKGGNGVVYQFENGNITTNTPAFFMTGDLYFQTLLEESEIFAQGKVKFNKTTAQAVAEEAKRIAAEAQRKAKEAEAVAEPTTSTDPVDVADEEEEDCGIIAEPSVKTVQEAITYCADKFGIAVKTSAQAKKLALENGVDFINLKVGRK